MGIFALSSSSPRAEEQGRGVAHAGGTGPAAWRHGGGGEEGEWRSAAWGVDSLPRFEGRQPVEVALRWQVAVGPDQHGGGAAGLNSGPDPGKKEQGTSGVLVPTSARAVVQRGRELRGGRRPGAAAMVGGGVGARGES
jgi:hypothetical protein